MLPAKSFVNMLMDYAPGADGGDPQLSPLIADYNGLCPLYFLVGETEILGQLKQAYKLAHAQQATGAQLNKTFQKAFNVAKLVRSETQIQRGSISVSSVAVELAESIFDSLKSRQVLVIGAGEQARGPRPQGLSIVFARGGAPKQSQGRAGLLRFARSDCGENQRALAIPKGLLPSTGSSLAGGWRWEVTEAESLTVQG